MSCEKCNRCNLCGKSMHRSEDEKKLLTKRLNIIEGQVKGVKQMVDDDRYCEDILIQLSAIKKAIESLENTILSSHVENCVAYEIQSGNLDVIEEVMELFKKIR